MKFAPAPHPAPLPEVMNVREAADYLGVAEDTLYKYASGGILPAFKMGNRWRFRKEALDRWMDRESQKHQEQAQYRERTEIRNQ